MSKYFDGFASFDWNEMSNEKLVNELKEKCKYISQLKIEQKKEIKSVQSSKDQRIAELEKENKELKNENNEFCDYNKKLREEKQTAVKEFAEEVLRTMIEAKNEYRTFLERQRGFYQNFLRGRDWIRSNKIYAKIDKLLKERGIE